MVAPFGIDRPVGRAVESVKKDALSVACHKTHNVFFVLDVFASCKSANFLSDVLTTNI